MRNRVPHPDRVRTRGLGPLRVPGFAPLVVCVAGLGFGFGAIGVAVPAYASLHSGANANSVAGLLLGVWGVGSALGGIWFGTRRFALPLAQQLGILLGLVGASLAVLAVMPANLWLGVALFLGGIAIAPALTVENTIIGRITPAAMHNEAYTWVITISVGASALGGAASGLLADHIGVWLAFVVSGVVVALGGLVTGWPGGPIARADAHASVALEPGLIPVPAPTTP
jgi:MFS family permease